MQFQKDRSSYEERLAELGLQSLKARRTRADIIQTFKNLRGYDSIDKNTWFNTVGADIERLTRHTSYHGNLIPRRSESDMREIFFPNRVVRTSNNKLSTKTREFTTLLDAVDLESF